MGLFDRLRAVKKESAAFVEPPIPDDEKRYYQPDKYYTDVSYPGTEFERKVVLFEDRKKTSFPSSRGLYVAEILLLEYCSYGTYPNPKRGYPGFWWFSYGIRNVGYRLKTLEDRGFIELNKDSGRYYLTAIGEQELGENLYVPYMHKHKKKTAEDTRFGPEFNVWSINRILQGDTKEWRSVVDQEEDRLEKSRTKQLF